MTAMTDINVIVVVLLLHVDQLEMTTEMYGM